MPQGQPWKGQRTKVKKKKKKKEVWLWDWRVSVWEGLGFGGNRCELSPWNGEAVRSWCIASESISSHLHWNKVKDNMRKRICTDMDISYFAVKENLRTTNRWKSKYILTKNTQMASSVWTRNGVWVQRTASKYKQATWPRWISQDFEPCDKWPYVIP